MYETLRKEALACDDVQADASPIKVLDSDQKGTTQQGYLWVYPSPEAGLVFFPYRKGRGQHGPREVLANCEGSLQTDGYQVNDNVCLGKPITQVGCLAHARRQCYDAQESDPRPSAYVLERLTEIYRLNCTIQAAATNAEVCRKMRHEHSKPILRELKCWIEAERNTILPKSPIGQAMTSFQLPWKTLKATRLDGRFDLDHTMIEHTIRPLALGRKNYLFGGSHHGAERNAMMYPFMASCNSQQINPRDWLEDTLQRIGQHPVNKLKELLPWVSGGIKQGVVGRTDTT